MAKQQYEVSTTFWSIFHSMIRPEGIDEANKARNACMWLTSELSILKNVLLGIEPTLMGIVHDHWITNQESPSLDIIEDWLESNPSAEVEEALTEYKNLQDGLRRHAQEDLGALLNRKSEEAKQWRLDELITNVKVINTLGVEVRRGKQTESLKGPDDAIRYFIQKLDTGGIIVSDVKTHGVLQDCSQDLRDYYESVKRQDSNKQKIKCGIDSIDEAISFKKGQFVGVLGFTGQRKTSFCRSWVYNAALSGFTTLHVSLEQKFAEELYYYAIIHSHHPKWGQRFSITTKAYEDGLMTKAEEDFLFNEVLPDLEKLPGKIIIRQPTEGMTWDAMKTIAEVTDRIHPIDIFMIDYLTLCDTTGYGSEKDKHNENIKDAKRFSVNFRGGEGLLFLTPVQGNREGYDDAVKNEGRWDMSGVYMYSEYDKSVDTMLYVYLDDDLMADGQIIMGTAKSRRSDVIKPHKNAINCAVGYVSNLRKHSRDDKIIDDIIADL
jgi:hypothetical protein